MRKHRLSYSLLGAVVIFAIVLRLYLHVWLVGYVNRVLYDLSGYRGSIENLSIDLYRGAYRIEGLRIEKLSGKFPVPFASSDEVDLSLQWSALLHGRIVSDVTLTKPEINFAVDKTGNVNQTGEEIDWTKKIKDLMPIDINKVTFHEGKLTYRDFSANPQVDIFINNMEGEVHNLRNVVDKEKPLPSTFNIRGDSIGNGKLTLQAHANILKPVPDFIADTKLENINLPALNDYTDAYASLDFHEGNLSIYSQLQVKDSNLSGYIKPIATGIKLVDLKRDPNMLKLAWESVVSVVEELLENQKKNQLATRIDVSGRLDNVQTSLWSTIGGILRNAFVAAFNKQLGRE